MHARELPGTADVLVVAWIHWIHYTALVDALLVLQDVEHDEPAPYQTPQSHNGGTVRLPSQR